MGEVLRMFIAVEPDGRALAWLEGFRDALEARFPRVRWVRREHLHLTLNFLAAVPSGKMEDVGRACVEAALEEEPFTLDLGPPGRFGPRDAPRTLWMGFLAGKGLEALTRLQKKLERGLATLGFPPEDRPWNPHLTLGRNPRASRVEGWEDLLPPWPAEGKPRMEAGALSFYSSELAQGGPVHRLVRSAPLAAPAAAAGGKDGRS